MSFVQTKQLPHHLVAFLDILGTKTKVANKQFDDLIALDFANPVGHRAHEFRDSHFAVFSDCVIFSTPAEKPIEFLQILGEIYIEWYADAIFVRGGIAVGEIYWISMDSDERVFRRLPNFSFARVYGSALVEAVEIERSSGPGAFAFASDHAAQILSKAVPRSIYRGQNNVVVCVEDYRLRQIRCLFDQISQEADSGQSRHLLASVRLIDLICKTHD